MTYWQIAWPLILMGAGLPFFFVPLTTLALGNVEESETASAAGLQNFMRTLSGAVATSLATTMWEDKANYLHAQMVGATDRSGQALSAMLHSGMSMEAALRRLDGLVQSQSVTIATNQVMTIVAIAFAVSAMIIWLAPRPARAVDMTQAGH
jgi:DHA2 family multidrug resistance protein